MVDPNRFLRRRVRISGKEYCLAKAITGAGHSYAYIGEPTEASTNIERRKGRVFIKIPGYAPLDERELEVHPAVSGHPNIATVLGWGTIDSHSFLVIEYLAGGTLEEALQKRPIRSWPLKQRLQAFYHLCSAVQHLHQGKFLHRDIKLANILLRRQGDISDLVLTDFSLARGPQSIRITRPGMEEGTPGERAPEQAHGVEEITTKVDVFGLAYVFVALLWGLRASRQLGKIVESTAQGEIKFSPPKNRETSFFVPLLEEMIVRHPMRRPRIKCLKKSLFNAKPHFFIESQRRLPNNSSQRRRLPHKAPQRRRLPNQRHAYISGPNTCLLMILISILAAVGLTLILLGISRL